MQAGPFLAPGDAGGTGPQVAGGRAKRDVVREGPAGAGQETGDHEA